MTSACGRYIFVDCGRYSYLADTQIPDEILTVLDAKYKEINLEDGFEVIEDKYYKVLYRVGRYGMQRTHKDEYVENIKKIHADTIAVLNSI